MTGQTLGHYRIEAKLGQGGSGIVYKAFDTHLDRRVAIKVLIGDACASSVRKRRFVQEARAASALNHPNIIHIYDISSSGDTDYIAMEYVAGKTLHELIGTSGLPLRDVLKYSVQIADALARAHSAGILHRDLKPANIMVADDGHVKLLDFGLAKLTDKPADAEAVTATMIGVEAPLTEEGSIVGTVAYMSPEQVEGRALDARSDIFSFGSVLYEMVTGRQPFAGTTQISTISAILHNEPPPLSALAPNLPAELRKLILHCLRKDRYRRTQHMDDVKLALEDLRVDFRSGERPLESMGSDRTPAPSSDSIEAARHQEPSALVRRLFGSSGPKPYRLWEILHIKICVRCLVLVYLAWRFKNATSGTWSLALFFAILVCGTVQSIMATVLLVAGSMDKELLRSEAVKLAPWLRAFGLANGALAITMAAWAAEANTILAALSAILAIVIVLTALTLKPSMDRAAIYDASR